MATDGDAIRDAILDEMALVPGIIETNPAVIAMVQAIAYGIYTELQNLDDNTGTPPSTGHN